MVHLPGGVGKTRALEMMTRLLLESDEVRLLRMDDVYGWVVIYYGYWWLILVTMGYRWV